MTLKVYLYFTSHFLHILNTTIIKLEGNKVSILDIYELMNNLKNELETRIADNHFGFKTNCRLKKFTDAEKAKRIKNNFIAVLVKALAYLNKWFDFSEDNWLSLLKCVNLKSPLKYDSFEAIVA